MTARHAGFYATVNLIRDGIPFIEDKQQIGGVLPENFASRCAPVPEEGIVTPVKKL
jgi:hypothetical protein